MTRWQHPPEYRTRLCRVVNRLASERRYSAQDLLRRAMKRTDLSELGAPSAREGLEVLTTEINGSRDLTPIARSMMWLLVRRMLETRLRIIARHRASPELASTPIPRPIIIVSQARTGTTFLHQLLSRDPANRTLHRNELQMPLRAARPDQRANPYRRARWVAETVKRLLITRDGLAHLDALHPSGPEEPEECAPMLMRSFVSDGFQVTGPLPGYAEWLRQCGDEVWQEAYEYHRMELQQLTRSDRGERIVLKSPLHLQALRALLSVYPDATLVWTHRHPLAFVPSFLELVVTMWAIGSHRVDSTWFSQLVERSAGDLCRAVVVRDELPASSFHDISFASLVANPIDEVRRLYHARGETLTQAAERAMVSWLHTRPKGRRGRPSVEDFGLTPQFVERAHAPYLEVFHHRLTQAKH